jgi:RNA polymerase sigma factor (sigma-70 family)
MRRIKNEDLAELLTQAHFAPPGKRRKQVDCAEQLLDLIQKDKEYPFEFVCFKITGFRPKGDTGRLLIKGDELAEDLRVFIWKLSGQVASHAREQGEEVYTTKQLAKKMNVSTKTIDRWRKRGLRVRKYVFDDGRNRLGFLQSAVAKFLGENRRLFEKAGRFTRMTEHRRREIIKRAVALSKETSMSRHQIISRIAEETGKGQETIRCMLMGYEKLHPGAGTPELRKAGGQISPAEAAEMERLYKQQTSIRELMGRFGKSRSSIHRILKHRRIQALLARKIEFIRSDEFVRPDAQEWILASRVGVEGPGQIKPVVMPVLRGHSIGEYLEGLKNAPVLNRQEEMELFRKYNYLKYRANLARENLGAGPSAKLRTGNIPSTRLDEIEGFLAEAEAVKRIIIEANLRLVVGIASKHTITGANLADLVSEGNVSLMQAMEKFDYTKGFRFSTYAGWTISKDFAHRIPGQRARQEKAAPSVSEFEEEMAAGLPKHAGVAAVERARHDLIQVIRNNLDTREQYIIINHFGLEGSLVQKNKKTLKQIGDELALSKERVRQVELIGLQKLRQSLSPEQFDLLTG